MPKGKKPAGAALVVEIGGPKPKGDGEEDLSEETYEVIGEALQEAMAAASSGDAKAAGRLLCEALDLKGGY